MIRQRSNALPPIYLDYQASTPLDPRVAQNLSKNFESCFANPHADDHAFGWEASKICEDASRRLAQTIGGEADEIVFTSGATEANNLAIFGLASRRQSGRHRILVSAIEHKSVLESARVAARRYDCAVEIIPVDTGGHLDLDALDRALDEDVLMVSVMAANNEIGTLQPSPDIGRLCQRVGALFHCDAVQALTAGTLNVQDIGADMVSLSAHKIYGPKGIGALYVRRDIQTLIEPLLVGGGQQHGLRAGTLPAPLCAGFADAAELISGPVAEMELQRVTGLRNLFAARMLANPHVHLNGPPPHRRHPSNCNLRFDGAEAKQLLAQVQPRLAASTGSACTSGSLEPSHVLTAIGLSEDQATSSIRFSFGRFSTTNDVDQASELMLSIFEQSRSQNRVA